MQVSDDNTTRIEAAYRQAFARKPTDSEIERAHDFIREADLMLVSTQNDENKRLTNAWAAFCQALLASNELRYVD
jgi:TorA maturation chaperone TorD